VPVGFNYIDRPTLTLTALCNHDAIPLPMVLVSLFPDFRSQETDIIAENRCTNIPSPTPAISIAFMPEESKDQRH
jgi:hypothetical protein